MNSPSEPVSLHSALDRITEHWSPRVCAELNDIQFKLAKIKGEFVWHQHDETDEAFLILKGEMVMRLRDGDLLLKEGDLYVVPKGVEHCPVADEECHIMLVEPRGVVNTGKAGGPLTAEVDKPL